MRRACVRGQIEPDRRPREAQDGLQPAAHCLPAAVRALWKCATAATSDRPKPGAGRIAAGLQPHKTLHHPRPVAPAECPARCRRRDRSTPALVTAVRIRHLAAGGRVFDGIVHQIGQRLRDQAAIAFDHAHAGARHQASATLSFLGQRLIQFDHIGGDDARSSGDMAPRVVPASVSAISSRALKVPISWSVSAMARSISPASEPAGLPAAPAIPPAGCAAG